jgi:murein DD-endopeptidase MepM/ murein hydrolase activator NlpD
MDSDYSALPTITRYSTAENTASIPVPQSGNNEFSDIMLLMMLGMSSGGQSDQSSAMQPAMLMPLISSLLAQTPATTEPEQPAMPVGLPLQGRISQEFHASHRALDFAVPIGTPVQATMPGTVTFAGADQRGYGNLVVVENGAYQTYYAHNSEINVQVGQPVSAGMIVGLSGNTGNSTGPHLHYEIRLNDRTVDPTPFTQSWRG